METDVLLVVLLAAGFLLGFVRGVIRQLIALAAWLICFVVAAQLGRFASEWLVTQEPGFSRQYADMLTFGVIFIVLFGIAVVFIEIYGTVSDLTTHESLDEVLGGLLAAGVTLLMLATFVVILDSFYAIERPAPTTEISFLQEIYFAFERSTIVDLLRSSLIPGLGSILGLFLPDNVREAMT